MTISSDILLDGLIDYISTIEWQSLRRALNATTFSAEMVNEVVTVLAKFGCRSIPTPSTLNSILCQIANYEFCIKTAAAISLLHSGIPEIIRHFG